MTKLERREKFLRKEATWRQIPLASPSGRLVCKLQAVFADQDFVNEINSLEGGDMGFYDPDFNSLPQRAVFLPQGIKLGWYYNELLSHRFERLRAGYDDKFGYHVDWIKDEIDKRLDQFFELGKGAGLKHMDCRWKHKADSGEGHAQMQK
ncbi:hypothetical protein M011DRAFT_490817 [Sporormia fimetaria CBS 119925]|uniref:Uncharacterized protein n=1 Tax=Sporormia fimetaria CBS 119925 TaxID=1340428 RepID=A0A6A6UWL9_9PLEO|nr:hypothetical protein M011DRAFT_490817 [Sporormia fimetaria CBS 119925]